MTVLKMSRRELFRAETLQRVCDRRLSALYALWLNVGPGGCAGSPMESEPSVDISRI